MIQMRRYWTQRENTKRFFPSGRFGHIGKAIVQLLDSGDTLTVYTYRRDHPLHLSVDITAQWLFPWMGDSDNLVKITIGTSVRKYQVRIMEG